MPEITIVWPFFTVTFVFVWRRSTTGFELIVVDERFKGLLG